VVPGVDRRVAPVGIVGEPPLDHGREGRLGGGEPGGAGRLAHGEPGEQGGRRVHVGALVDGAGGALLGGGEPVGAGRGGEARRRGEVLGQAEVGEHELDARGGLAHEQVVGRQVAVHDATPVQGVEGGGDARRHAEELGPPDRLAVVDQPPAVGGEVAAGQVLEHEVGLVPLGLVELVQPHDVRAGDAPEEPGLGDEALADVGVEAVVVGEHLDRDRAVDALVDGPIHGRERPGAEDADDAEPADRRGGGGDPRGVSHRRARRARRAWRRGGRGRGRCGCGPC